MPKIKNRQNNKLILAVFIIISLVLTIQSQQPGSAKTNEVGDASMLRFYAVNVGQGDCSYFAFPNGQNMLVDAGTAKSKGAVLAFLKEHKVKKIDLLIATHPHSDHIGSICAVIDKYEIGEVWDNGCIYGSNYQKDFYKTVLDKKIRFRKVSAGYTKNFGTVNVKVFAPVRILSGTNSDTNNNSIVMLVTYGDVKFLLAGDMERAERDTFELPSANVLKAAHHGSKTGTNSWLLSRVNPQIITISYGEDNDYGHPDKSVVNAIKKFGIKRFDTKDGTICIATDGKELKYNKKQVVPND